MLFRLAVCIFPQRFRLTVSTTEQLTSTAALLRRAVSGTDCTVALSCGTSNLSTTFCSLMKDAIQLSVLLADGCTPTDNAAPASCVAIDERRLEHRMPFSCMTFNDPSLLHSTPHIPKRKFPHYLSRDIYYASYLKMQTKSQVSSDEQNIHCPIQTQLPVCQSTIYMTVAFYTQATFGKSDKMD